MDRSVLTRRVAPFAVFAAVLGGVLVLNRPGGKSAPRPLPISARDGAAENTAAGTPKAADSRLAYWGEIRFPNGVPANLPDDGPAYRLDKATATSERVSALAKALGLDGTPKAADGGWEVTDGDRTLHVANLPGLPWYYGSGREKDGVAVASCVDPVPLPPDAPVSAEPTEKPTEEPRPEPATCSPAPEPTPPPQPTDDEARTAALPVLRAGGVDPATARSKVVPGWGTKEVLASPVLGGLVTWGFDTNVGVDVNGSVTHANGFLGTAELEDRYPLLTPQKAAERGNTGGGPEPLIGAPQCDADTPDCAAPPSRDVVDVDLVLTFLPSFDATSASYLVPAWLLTFDKDMGQLPVVALPDEYLATPPAPTAKPDDGTGSGGSVDGNTGAPAVSPS